MNTSEDRWNALTLELVPLDAPVPALAARAAEPVAPVQDAGRIRDAYLNARFPGVIRTVADLADAGKVAEAVRCYARDGHLDRARELAGLALADHSPCPPREEARTQATQPRGDTAQDGRSRPHATQIRRYLAAERNVRPRGH